MPPIKFTKDELEERYLIFTNIDDDIDYLQSLKAPSYFCNIFLKIHENVSNVIPFIAYHYVNTKKSHLVVRFKKGVDVLLLQNISHSLQLDMLGFSSKLKLIDPTYKNRTLVIKYVHPYETIETIKSYLNSLHYSVDADFLLNKHGDRLSHVSIEFETELICSQFLLNFPTLRLGYINCTIEKFCQKYSMDPIGVIAPLSEQISQQNLIYQKKILKEKNIDVSHQLKTENILETENLQKNDNKNLSPLSLPNENLENKNSENENLEHDNLENINLGFKNNTNSLSEISDINSSFTIPFTEKLCFIETTTTSTCTVKFNHSLSTWWIEKTILMDHFRTHKLNMKSILINSNRDIITFTGINLSKFKEQCVPLIVNYWNMYMIE